MYFFIFFNNYLLNLDLRARLKLQENAYGVHSDNYNWMSKYHLSLIKHNELLKVVSHVMWLL